MHKLFEIQTLIFMQTKSSERYFLEIFLSDSHVHVELIRCPIQCKLRTDYTLSDRNISKRYLSEYFVCMKMNVGTLRLDSLVSSLPSRVAIVDYPACFSVCEDRELMIFASTE